jgi:asparagine synthase (glutamine-hydrolysing)
MGAFFLAQAAAGVPEPGNVARLKRAFADEGLGMPRELRAQGWHLAVYPKLCGGDAQLHVMDADNFAFVTGTILYKGKAASEALATLFSDAIAGRFDWADARGAYALGLCLAGRFTLRCDPVGVYKIYRDDSWRVIASSFPAILAGILAPTASRQGVYEYVFQAATYGGKTIVDQIMIADHRHVIELGPPVRLQPVPPAPKGAAAEQPFDVHLDRSLATLRARFRDIVSAFGDNIEVALSGGYDSRLILALLRDHGVRPRLYVYGRAQDKDVSIAHKIAAGEGLPLRHTDKALRPKPAPDALPAVVARNCLLFDGYPPDGIFDTGVDAATRAERATGGALVLTGGGGEIFRNFFHLPDRTFSVRQLIWTFYSQYDPASCTAAFRETDYVAELAAATAHTLGREGEVLTRWDVEYLYPYFRCSYWMGRGHSIDQVFGFALAPFTIRDVIAIALDVPIRFKNHGRFEAALIRAADPVLACYPSGYGHDFAHDPPLARRLKEYGNLLRPPVLRRYSFRIKHRHPAPRPYALQDETLRRVIDPRFPIMSAFFQPDRVHETSQFARLCTLEYLFSRYGVNCRASEGL